MNPVSSNRSRSTSEVEQWWGNAPRSYRRAATRWWHSHCKCPRGINNYQELWLLINNHNGIVPAELIR